MQEETNQAYLRTVKKIKELHQKKSLPFSDLRLVVKIYPDEAFEVIYICPPDNDPIIFSWPNSFKPNSENDKPEKTVLFRFTDEGHHAPVMEFKQTLYLILHKYLNQGGVAEKFVCRIIVKNDIYCLTIISREESLSQIAMYGSRMKDEKLLPPGDGDYLIQIRNSQVTFTNFS